ncbi:MAG TPA: outer membrane protein assembly factor BamA [Xanthobacteraceae bacterium]|nr:outer membrane protein assembly factor BamA [Xanthobacteraceae bacterium]
MKIMVRVLGRLAILAVLAFAGTASVTAYSVVTAAVANAQTVSSIVVQGNRRVDSDAIRSYLQIRPGERVDPLKIDDGLKALYATGLFQDVKINMAGGGRLVVSVVENTVLNRVVFEGNKKIKDETLASEIQSKARGPLNTAIVQSDVQRIIEVYRRGGRYDVRVDPKIIERSNGRSDLIFEINEGDKTTISKITFVGNKAFSDYKLRDVMSTTEKTWLSWIKNTDVYDPDRVSADQEALRRFYLKNGYADFRIVSANVDLDRSRGGFVITITVDEGQQYRTGTVDLVSNVRDLDGATLRGFVRTTPGDVYNAEMVEKSIENITMELAKRGYAFAQVRPRGDRNFETHRINIVYTIEQGSRVYIERINIVGNTRTRDYVIRREFDVYEGDPYNHALINRAERRLKNLGYFKDVRITTEPGSAPDRVIVNVNVQDNLTGEFSISGGYSTAAGLMGEVAIGERNFLGRGQYVRASVGYGQYQRGVELSFSDPYLLGNRIGGGINLFAKEQLPNDFQSYSVSTYGGSLKASLPLSEEASLGLRYSLFQRDLDVSKKYKDGCRTLAGNVVFPANCDTNPNYLGPGLGAGNPAEVSSAIKQALGTTLTSSVGYTLAWNSLDNNKDPTMGNYVSFSQDFAGVGGDVNYLRSSIEARTYKPLWGDVVGMLKGTAGYITPTGGKQLNILDGFFKGPELVRGFEPAGIGPRDLGSNFKDALGGSQYWSATAELQFPLSFLPKDLGLKAAIFADAGSLWGYKGDTNLTQFGTPYNGNCPSGTNKTSGPSSICVADDNTIRSSAGVSLIWSSPFGPIRFDFAQAISKASYDKTQFFRFTGGTQF